MTRVKSFPKARPTSAWFSLFVAAVALFSLSVPARAGSIVVDGGFEAAGGGNVYFAGQSIDGGAWNVTAGAIYIDTQDPWVYAGNNSVNLTLANLYVPNSLSQQLTTTPGQFYDVSFWANSDTPNSFSLTENGTSVNGIPGSIVQNGFPDQIDPDGNSSLFVDYTGWFVATSATTDLTFTSTGDPALGSSFGSVMIDNVDVTTPEPASIVLLLSGIAALGLLLAIKRKGLSFSGSSI
jgi:hypothetical protein